LEERFEYDFLRKRLVGPPVSAKLAATDARSKAKQAEIATLDIRQTISINHEEFVKL
jgi:hypothetical protein